MGIPAIISSDAHHYSEISLEFEAAEEALKQAGYRSVVNFKEGRWTLCDFNCSNCSNCSKGNTEPIAVG